MVRPSPAERPGSARRAWRPYLVLCHHVRTPPHEGGRPAPPVLPRADRSGRPLFRNHEVTCMKVGVLKETAPGDRRVALVPEMVGRLQGAGLDVLVQSGAGDGAWFADSAYAEAGAAIVSRDELLAEADVVVGIGRPEERVTGALRAGQALVGLLNPLVDPAFAAAMAARGVTAISMDGLPRTLPRAQGMDALTSQANVAGYKAALVGAATFGRFFPLLITAAGTARPAKVLVLGTGVAGLQAIGTAKRLGAVVSAYDVRPQTKTEVESLGATFIELTSVGPAAGEGGYARALAEDERAAQRPSWPATSPGTTWSSPPHRYPGDGRRCWSPTRRS